MNRQASWRNRQIGAGRCGYCGKNPLVGKARCAECQAKKREYERQYSKLKRSDKAESLRKYRVRMKVEKRCRVCGVERDGLSLYYCTQCLVKARKRQRARRGATAYYLMPVLKSVPYWPDDEPTPNQMDSLDP